MRKFIYLLFLIFSLTGCALNEKDENKDGLQTISKLDAYSDSSVLYYADNKIYLYDIVMNSTKGSSDFKLYEHDLSSGITKQLGRISDFHTTTNSVVSTDKGFAFTVCTYNEKNFINNLYYYQDGSLVNVYSWNSNIPMSYIYKIANEEILLFSPDSIAEEENEYYIYKISKIDLNKKTNIEVKSFRYNITEQKGEIVPAIDFYNNTVCVLKKAVKDGEDNYRVCSYDLEGRLVNANEINISDFLYLEQTASYDSVYKLECLENNIFVLQTLNSRIIMFEKIDNEFVRLSVPDKLSEFPDGYKIAKYFNDKGREIYFSNKFNDNLVKFDVFEKEFSELSIVKNFQTSYVSSLNINSDEDIFIKMDEHFYLSKENEFKVFMYSLFLDKEQTESVSSEEQTKAVSSEERLTEEEYDVENIIFNDLPENDAEAIVCYDLLERQSVCKWIEVTELKTLEFEELKKQEDYDNLFEQLRNKLAPEMELDDYVRMILDNGCAVVFIRYEDKYTEEYNASLPQNSDGVHEQFWLFVPDENNQLRIYDNTQTFSHFNFRNKTDVPDSLILSKEK